jgi:hypothetical protein
LLEKGAGQVLDLVGERKKRKKGKGGKTYNLLYIYLQYINETFEDGERKKKEGGGGR